MRDTDTDTWFTVEAGNHTQELGLGEGRDAIYMYKVVIAWVAHVIFRWHSDVCLSSIRVFTRYCIHAWTDRELVNMSPSHTILFILYVRYASWRSGAGLSQQSSSRAASGVLLWCNQWVVRFVFPKTESSETLYLTDNSKRSSCLDQLAYIGTGIGYTLVMGPDIKDSKKPNLAVFWLAGIWTECLSQSIDDDQYWWDDDRWGCIMHALIRVFQALTLSLCSSPKTAYNRCLLMFFVGDSDMEKPNYKSTNIFEFQRSECNLRERKMTAVIYNY